MLIFSEGSQVSSQRCSFLPVASKRVWAQGIFNVQIVIIPWSICLILSSNHIYYRKPFMNIQLSHSQERSNVTWNIGAEDNMEILELQWPRLLAKTCFVSTINCFVKSILFYLYCPEGLFLVVSTKHLYICMYVCIYVYACMYVCFCFFFANEGL